MPANDHMSKVSIIITTYNRSALLRAAVESVLAQTYPNIEIIVIDDGSTDDTAEVMSRYADRITYVWQENRGADEAFMAGLEIASGHYIGALDHDDLFMPTKIERQVQVLDSRPEVGLVHCHYYHIDENGNTLNKVSVLLEGNVLKDLVLEDSIWSGAPLIRRECLDRVGLPTGYCSDWKLLLRIAQAGYQFACVPLPLGAYRIMQNSQMANITALEHGAAGALDMVFADPQLPPDVIMVQQEAYSRLYFYLSCRYYAAGYWDEAQRTLTEALTRCPQLLQQPEELLLPSLRDGALDIRVTDPINFITNVFEHLPTCVESLKQYRSRVLSQVYLGLAMRNYGAGSVAEAKIQLTEAIKLDSSMLQQPAGFAEALVYNSTHLPVKTPLQFIDTVLQNLPPDAHSLDRVRSQVLSEVNIGSAFENYAAGRQDMTIYQVLTALRYRPSWLRNRGVLSIFIKSLLQMLRLTGLSTGRSMKGM